MGRRNKILESDHYQEIHDKLASGEKPKDVAEWYNGLPDIPYTIDARTFTRYYSKYIKQEDEIRARYNERKKESKSVKPKKLDKHKKEAEENSQKIREGKIETKLVNDKKTDEFIETAVDGLFIIDELLNKSYDKLDIDNLDDKQLSELIVKLLNTKAKWLGLDKINIVNNIENNNDLSKLIKTDKIRERLNEKRKRRRES